MLKISETKARIKDKTPRKFSNSGFFNCNIAKKNKLTKLVSSKL